MCGGEEMGNVIVARQHGKDQNELRPVPSINPLNPLILLFFFLPPLHPHLNLASIPNSHSHLLLLSLISRQTVF